MPPTCDTGVINLVSLKPESYLTFPRGPPVLALYRPMVGWPPSPPALAQCPRRGDTQTTCQFHEREVTQLMEVLDIHGHYIA